jgi:hypothetical protein
MRITTRPFGKKNLIPNGARVSRAGLCQLLSSAVTLRPRVSPPAGVYRIKDGQLRLVDDPQGIIEGIGGGFLGGLGFSLCLLDVALVPLAVHPIAQVLRFAAASPFIDFH